MSTEDRLDEISSQMQELSNEQFKLSKQLMIEQQEKLKPLVGTCFWKESGNQIIYYKVVDVPQEDKCSIRFSFNPYQIPVIELGIDYTISRVTVFSRAINEDDPVAKFATEYNICTTAEFNDKLNEIIKNIKEI